MLGRLKHVHFVVHLVLVENLLEVLAVLITIVNRDCDSSSAKSTRSTNPVQIVLRVTDPLVTSLADPLRGHVKVDHNLNLWHIDTSREHVCRDNNADFSRPELFNHLISLLVAHLTKNDCRFEVLAAHHFVQAVRVILRIDENDRLSHFTDVEDFFDEFGLFALFAAVLKLLDMVKR